MLICIKHTCIMLGSQFFSGDQFVWWNCKFKVRNKDRKKNNNSGTQQKLHLLPDTQILGIVQSYHPVLPPPLPLPHPLVVKWPWNWRHACTQSCTEPRVIITRHPYTHNMPIIFYGHRGKGPVSDRYPVSDHPTSTQPYIFKVEYHPYMHIAVHNVFPYTYM